MPYKDQDKQREYCRIWIAKRRADYFKDKICIVCGSIERLELDHINPSTKISNSIWSWSQERREAEIAKCQVLCHDHHLEKTKNDPRLKKLGSDSPRSRFTETDILEIRRLYSEENLSYVEIGKMFNTRNDVIGNIIRRASWTHI